jgi:molybdopterin converting factor small subunit
VPEAAITVELFGVARLVAGTRAVTLPAPSCSTLADVVQALAAQLPALVGPVIAPDRRSLTPGYILNLNGRDFVPDLAREVQAGDAVLLIAAAAGGAAITDGAATL